MKPILGVLLLILLAAPAASFELTVVSYNVESDSDTKSDSVATDLKRVPQSHIWGLSEVYARDFETYRKAIGENFELIEGETGSTDRLAIIFDPAVLEQIGQKYEPDAGGSRHPLIARFKVKETNQEFLFVVNHLQRGRGSTDKKRQAQAKWLNNWVQGKAEKGTLPAIILAGDYNFDVDPKTKKGNPAYKFFMKNGRFRWVEPFCIASGNCPPTGTACNPRYNSILDFVFLAGPAQTWKAESEILFKDETNYCKKEELGGSDHRPIRAVLTIPSN